MEAVQGILRSYGVDLAIWCGCNRKFYDLCGCPLMSNMFDCPFNTENSAAAKRRLFYYMVINSVGQKFQKNVVEFYNQDTSTRKFSIEFKNDALKQYYGLFRDDKENNGATANAASTNGATADDGVINENLQYDVKDGVDEVTISFKISNYSCDNLRFTMVEGGKYLVVSGLREDKQSNNKYKFEINFRMDPAISSDTIEATYEEDESIVTVVAKSKIMHVGCSRN